MNFDLKKTEDLLTGLMRASVQEVTSRFAGLSGAITLPCKYKGKTGDAVFVPGHREDRVLLVAHTDTVWGPNRDEVKIARDGQILYSSSDANTGIGADDRAGCAALWMLRKSGHSLLIVPDEEVGCVGSSYVSEHYADILKDHQFAIQFDRRGSKDLVTYDCDSREFDCFLEKSYPSYEDARGSFSDIGTLCPALDIAGVNVSIGYEHEHTAYEYVDMIDFQRTVELTRRLLQRRCPKFRYEDRWNRSSDLRYDRYGNSRGKKLRSESDLEVIDFSEDTCPDCRMGWKDCQCTYCDTSGIIVPKELESDDSVRGDRQCWYCSCCGRFFEDDEIVAQYGDMVDEDRCPDCMEFLEPFTCPNID